MERRETIRPVCLFPGDPRVRMLLGKQKLPTSAEETIRKSSFVYTFITEGVCIVFHMLTRELLVLPLQEMEYFEDGRFFQSSVLEEELPAKLYEDHFLVPEHTQEDQIYLELKDILVLKEELPRGITQYVILPTTTCNARCFYCFEQGMQYHKMTPETVEDTIRFVQLHKPLDRKKIHIHWFGGEPMCAADNIDRICAGLTKAGLEFTAEMTSNGSLFTEESAQKAAHVWKIEKIQITLDGMAEEYARRKRYSKLLKDPFQTVIRNIHLLIAAGILVSVRLNVDENNLQEIYQVIDYLKKEFTEEELHKLHVYAHSLFGQPGEGLDACPVKMGSDTLEAHVLKINEYILKNGLTFPDLDSLFNLKSHFCMVTALECNVLIDAAGRLFACDAMPEDMRYGDVKNGIDTDAWNRVASRCQLRQECRHCVFLPECTEFDRCPNRIAYDDCFKQEKRKLESELRFVYMSHQEQNEHRDQKNQKNQEDQKFQEDQEDQEDHMDQKLEKPAEPMQAATEVNPFQREEAIHVSD